MFQVVQAITRFVEQLPKLDLIDKQQCQDDQRVLNIEIRPTAQRLPKHPRKIDRTLLDLHGIQLVQHLG